MDTLWFNFEGECSYVQLDSALGHQLSAGNLNQCPICLSQEEYFRQSHSNFKSTEQLHGRLPVVWLIFPGPLFDMVILLKTELVSLSTTYSFSQFKYLTHVLNSIHFSNVSFLDR